MNKKLIPFLLLALAALFAFQNAPILSAKQANKYLVVLQASRQTHEGMARAVHALLYTEELLEHGHEVVLVFDGAGTEWIEKWLNDDGTGKLAPMYFQLAQKGVAVVVCDYCAGAFDVKEGIQKHEDANLIGEYKGHPSIAKYADEGYQIIIL